MSNLRERMLHDMQLHGYAEKTQEIYLWTVKKLQQFYMLSPDKISEEQLREYFIFRKNVSGWAPATMRITYAGIKFFFTYTLKREWKVLQLVRAKSERKLPTVLTTDEVRSILKAVKTHPNKAYLTLVYSWGLRLQEGLNLQVADIDDQRMFIHVHLGKGAKDRYVPLPDSTQTVQGALRSTVKKMTSITKRVSVHTLRHSYATHLLEAGVNIRQVQHYLGHSSLASTMVYVHVTKVGHQDACGRINRLMKGVGK